MSEENPQENPKKHNATHFTKCGFIAQCKLTITQAHHPNKVRKPRKVPVCFLSKGLNETSQVCSHQAHGEENITSNAPQGARLPKARRRQRASQPVALVHRKGSTHADHRKNGFRKSCIFRDANRSPKVCIKVCSECLSAVKRNRQRIAFNKRLNMITLAGRAPRAAHLLMVSDGIPPA